jgi:hypothetical protein
MHAAGQALPSAVDGTVYINNVTPGYFEAIGMAVHRGRDFGPQDTSSSPKTAIINARHARRVHVHEVYRTFLFGVTSMDPTVVSVVAVAVVVLAVAGGYIPARGAGQVDSLVALRDE